MRTTPLALPSALVLGVLLATPFACRKDDGTTPNPSGPVEPSAAVTTVEPPTAPSAEPSAVLPSK